MSPKLKKMFQCARLITGIQQLEDTFSTERKNLLVLLNMLGLGGKRRNCRTTLSRGDVSRGGRLCIYLHANSLVQPLRSYTSPSSKQYTSRYVLVTTCVISAHIPNMFPLHIPRVWSRKDESSTVPYLVVFMIITRSLIKN